MTYRPYIRARGHYVTPVMRDILVEHLDGASPINRVSRQRARSLRALIERGWLFQVGIEYTSRPRKTHLTEAGRAALGQVLGEYIDTLVRAGFGGTAIPREAGGVAPLRWRKHDSDRSEIAPPAKVPAEV